jgi:hypothetical protein
LALAVAAEQRSPQNLRRLGQEYSLASELDTAWAATSLAGESAHPRNRGTQVCPLRTALASVHRAADRNPSARVSRPDLLLERPRPASQAESIRRLLQSVARSRRTRWPNAIRAMLHNCIPTGRSSPLRLAIRLFWPLSHANCRVIRNSPWSSGTSPARWRFDKFNYTRKIEHVKTNRDKTLSATLPDSTWVTLASSMPGWRARNCFPATL